MEHGVYREHPYRYAADEYPHDDKGMYTTHKRAPYEVLLFCKCCPHALDYALILFSGKAFFSTCDNGSIEVYWSV